MMLSPKPSWLQKLSWIGFSSIGAVTLVLFALFLFSYQSTIPSMSEIAYTEHSQLKDGIGSVVPASCDSASPFQSPTSAGGTAGSHFNGDCQTLCPGSSTNYYDPYYDPSATSCPPSVCGNPIWAGRTDPTFNFGIGYKTSLCGANHVMLGTRFYECDQHIDDEYAESYCSSSGVSGLGAPSWYSAANAWDTINGSYKTVLCPAGQVMVGTRMYGHDPDVDEEHIDAYCAPITKPLGAPHWVQPANAYNTICGGFKVATCPDGEVMVGTRWYEWSNHVDDEHIDAYCAPMTMSCGAECTWRPIDQLGGYASVQKNRTPANVCNTVQPNWSITTLCPAGAASGVDSVPYADGERCYVTSSKFSSGAAHYDTRDCMATAYVSVCNAPTVYMTGSRFALAPTGFIDRFLAWGKERLINSVQAAGSIDINEGNTVTLRWSSVNTTGCILDLPGYGSSYLPSNGSFTTPSLSAGSLTATIKCYTGGVGSSPFAQDQVLIRVAGFRICPQGCLACLGNGGTANLQSFYNASAPIDCSDTSTATNVTASSAWSSSSPAIATVANGLVTSISNTTGDTSTITATYDGASDSSTIRIICSPTLTCASSGPAADVENTCAGKQTPSYNDGCGNLFTCGGSRRCDFNWKEISQ